MKNENNNAQENKRKKVKRYFQNGKCERKLGSKSDVAINTQEKSKHIIE